MTAVHSPFTLPFPVAHGLTTYPQSLYGNETHAGPDPSDDDALGHRDRTADPGRRCRDRGATSGCTAANFVRFFVTRDAGYDVTQYDPANFRQRVEQVSSIIDSSDPDLSAFFARGGKLILRENMGDLAQSPLAGINYFAALTARVGRATVDRAARLYISPASNHSGPASSVSDASVVPTAVDLLDPLDTWVTTGRAPANALVQTRKTAMPPFTVQASRPMCRYPAYPPTSVVINRSRRATNAGRRRHEMQRWFSLSQGHWPATSASGLDAALEGQ